MNNSIHGMKKSKIKPKVYIVMPNKNGIKHLQYSIPSLMDSKYSNFFCIVVDDSSSDESMAFIEKNYPGITIIRNRSKKGFAGSVNLGIKYSLEQGAEYIAVCNSDIKVLPDWINDTIDIFSMHRNVGLVGYEEIPKEREDEFYGFKDMKIEFNKVKNVSGFIYLCSSRVFEHVGLLDEDYFMYGEDNDFYCRLKKAGYSIFQTNIPVWHYGEGAGQNQKLINTWLTYRNAIRFSIKNENLIEICRMFFALLYLGCTPFLRRTEGEIYLKRLRRYNFMVNFVLLLGSVFWNIYYLPKTLRLRVLTNKTISSSRL